MNSLGQIAYETYAAKLHWKSPFTGQTLKEWDTLKIMNPIVAEAWECAAVMVADWPRDNPEGRVRLRPNRASRVILLYDENPP
jgi:hypothetical protein